MMGGASVLSCRVNVSRTAENEAISSENAANALVEAILEIFGGGVGVGTAVGLTVATGSTSGGDALLR